MKEKSVPALAPTNATGTLGELPARNALRSPDRVAFRRRSDDGWSPITAAMFASEVAALAKGLIASGVQAGDTVGVMSRTRYEWTLADFALWAAGAVPVPIYETSSPDQIQWILSDSGAVAVIVEHAEHAASIDGIRDQLPALRTVWAIDLGDLDSVAATGAPLTDDELAGHRAGLDRSSLATIIYTSGTTGRPKGVELSHGNFLDLTENAHIEMSDIVDADGASTLLFLPLAHVFARFIEVLCVDASVTMGHSADIKNLLEDFAAFEPTFILAVPRVFEKVFNSAEAKASGDGRGAIFEQAAAAAIAWSEATDAGKVPLTLRVKHALFDTLVYGKLRAAMGGRVTYAVSGGAPLGTRLGHFFRGIGVTILEGYGLTETTAPVTVNRPSALRIGTVGMPLPGSSVRIAEDGEVLLKGVGTFRTYHDNPEATAEAIHDGWFHTGDLGELDGDGFLKITGRKKEILVTAGGKNVAPAILEDRLRAHPLVSQCIVVGDQRPFIGALVTLDAEMVPVWGANHGFDGLTVSKARTNPTVMDELQRAVDTANEAVSKAESIRKFAVLEDDFTEENGYLTPSLKLKRNVVMRDFTDEVDGLYAT
ncbi:MAG: AMP-dependent synthetase/ligase [Nostocoides sp.]